MDDKMGWLTCIDLYRNVCNRVSSLISIVKQLKYHFNVCKDFQIQFKRKFIWNNPKFRDYLEGIGSPKGILS